MTSAPRPLATSAERSVEALSRTTTRTRPRAVFQIWSRQGPRNASLFHDVMPMKHSTFDLEEIRALNDEQPKGSVHLDVEKRGNKILPQPSDLDKRADSSRAVPQRDQFGIAAIPS